MAEKHKVKLGKDGMLKFPKELRRLYGLREGIVINPVWDERMECTHPSASPSSC